MEEGSIQTKKQKSPLLLVAVIVFLALWLIFAALFLYAIDNVYCQKLQNGLALDGVQMQQNIKEMADDSLLEVTRLLPARPGSINELASVLDAMEGNAPGYRAVDAAGRLYDAAGHEVGALPAELLQQAQTQGYAVLALDDFENAGPHIVLLAPVGEGLYLAQMHTPATYAAAMLNRLQTDGSVSALFSPAGIPIVQTDSASTQASQLAGGAAAFAAGGSSLQRSGLLLSYNVYIAAPAPQGWVWGAYVGPSVVFSEFGVLLRVIIVPFALWVVLLVAFIAYTALYRRRTRSQVLAASQIDPLTKLANNAGMSVGMQRYFKRRPMAGSSLVCVDISAFHRFNTMYGYANGDALLRCVGNAIAENFECGTRTSSDIFVFIAPSSASLHSQAEAALQKAVEADLGPQFVEVVTFKLGIFPILDETHTLREVYDGALLALRDAKKRPKSNVVVFDQQLQQRSEMQKQIELNMLGALSNGEFLVYLQPKFNVENGHFCGSEALIRWKSEALGFLTPDDFIPLFESNGFIVELDFFMLEEVLKLLQFQFDEGLPISPISVNQSRITLAYPGYLDRLKGVLDRYTVPLNFLEIEITESALEEDSGRIVQLVRAFKQLGLMVSLDDFGSGFSSLNTLRQLPVDTLKIDKGFLDESGTSPRSRTIIEQVIILSHRLGMGVVCEGVETSEQLTFLKQAECDVLQGFLFAKALFFRDFMEFYIFNNTPDGGPHKPQAEGDAPDEG